MHNMASPLCWESKFRLISTKSTGLMPTTIDIELYARDCGEIRISRFLELKYWNHFLLFHCRKHKSNLPSKKILPASCACFNRPHQIPVETHPQWQPLLKHCSKSDETVLSRIKMFLGRLISIRFNRNKILQVNKFYFIFIFYGDHTSTCVQCLNT